MQETRRNNSMRGQSPFLVSLYFDELSINSFKKASKAYGTIYYTNRRYKELFSVLFFLWVPPPYLFFGPISPGLGKSTVLWTLSPRGVRVHFVKKNRIADQKSKDNLLPVLPFLYLFTEKTRKQRSVGPLTGFDLRRRALYSIRGSRRSLHTGYAYASTFFKRSSIVRVLVPCL